MLHKQICLKHPDSPEQTNQDGTIIYEVPKNKFEMISQQAIWTNYQDMEMLTFFFSHFKAVTLSCAGICWDLKTSERI